MFCPRGQIWCWRWFGWRRMSNFRLSCLRCNPIQRQRTDGHTPCWMLCGGRLVTNKTTAVNSDFLLSPRQERGHPPRRGPGPPIMGAARAKCCPSRFSWQTGSSHHSTFVPIDDPFDPWLDHTSNCWPLKEHHYADVFAVKASFKTDDHPLF